ncbi:hypothetical protein Cgig2_003265 [Carnegiea gigantea]|uniref:F-box domain-containing protein n=1 Tax=Carnegiea gigantea TaxID=171969 RepID=A0A9Q1GTF8_9CARY|nr:hypothetical protein Cgig2_003265 [Carnegiea gigantea]
MKRRKRTHSTSSVTLPQEICCEILSRLPTKPLLRFRCVSKLWYSLIDDPYFVKINLINCPKNNQENAQLLVIEPADMFDARQLCTFRRGDTFRKISSLGLDVTWYEHYQVAGYIHGVFCMKKYRMETQVCEVFLWNPSIRKCLDLPLPHIAYIGMKLDVDLAFGYDPVRNEFKVIASLYAGGGIHIPQFVELYTLSKGFWRAIAIGKGPRAWSKDGPKVFLNGVTCWVGTDLMKATPKGKYTHLVSFDAHNEVFNYTELPDCEDVNAWEHQRFPVVVGESVALMEVFQTHSHIWVKEELRANNTSWSKRYSINLQLSHKFLHLKSDGELLFGEDKGVKSYNIENHETKVLAKSYRLTPVFAGVYIESLLIPRTRFVVDGFQNAGDFSISYFLSHFHSDNYSGLTSDWSAGIVFCSNTTARLAVDVLGVSPLLVVRLPMNEPVLIDGCELTLIDANHCPGAVQFLFKIPIGGGKFERFVHTGDFGYRPSMKIEPSLSQFVGCEALFLDITCCHPKFVFPSHEESIDYIVSVIERIGAENRNVKCKVLFLVAGDIVGKERALMEVSLRCGHKFHVNSRTMKTLKALGHADEGVFTEEESATEIHDVGWDLLGENWPYFQPNFVKIKGIIGESGHSKVVGFVLTGWSYEVKRNKFVVRIKDTLEIHLVPCNEHSSFSGLRDYVKFLKPKQVVPAVGSDVKYMDSKHAIKMQKHFAGLVDEIANEQQCSVGFWHESVGKSNNEIDDKVVGLDNVMKRTSQEQNVSEMKTGPGTDYVSILCPSASQEPSAQHLGLLTDEEKEEIVQELRYCLPIWVPEDQMLELIKSYGRDIVDAVSYFYEHETEFHEQSANNFSPSQSNSKSDYTSVVVPRSDEETAPKVVKMSNQNLKFPPLKPSVGNSVSPAKKRKNPGNKHNRKVKVNSDIQASGIKQSTITKFFSKTSNVYQRGSTAPVSGRCTAKNS